MPAIGNCDTHLRMVDGRLRACWFLESFVIRLTEDDFGELAPDGDAEPHGTILHPSYWRHV